MPRGSFPFSVACARDLKGERTQAKDIGLNPRAFAIYGLLERQRQPMQVRDETATYRLGGGTDDQPFFSPVGKRDEAATSDAAKRIWPCRSTKRSSRSPQWWTGGKRTTSNAGCAWRSRVAFVRTELRVPPSRHSQRRSSISPGRGPIHDRFGNFCHRVGQQAVALHHSAQRPTQEDGGGNGGLGRRCAFGGTRRSSPLVNSMRWYSAKRLGSTSGFVA